MTPTISMVALLGALVGTVGLYAPHMAAIDRMGPELIGLAFMGSATVTLMVKGR